jgi:hypothetical protein
LPLGTGVNAGVEEGAEQSSIAEQDPEKLVVIDVDGVKARRVEEIVAVDENRYATTVSEFPGRAGSRVKLHDKTSSVDVAAFSIEAGSELLRCQDPVIESFEIRRIKSIKIV